MRAIKETNYQDHQIDTTTIRRKRVQTVGGYPENQCIISKCLIQRNQNVCTFSGKSYSQSLSFLLTLGSTSEVWLLHQVDREIGIWCMQLQYDLHLVSKSMFIPCKYINNWKKNIVGLRTFPLAKMPMPRKAIQHQLYMNGIRL